MRSQIVTVTRKGQATIPKEMRDKHGISKRVIALDVKEGILLKPIPSPASEQGSLKHIFGKKTARQIIVEARSEDTRRDKELLEHSIRH